MLFTLFFFCTVFYFFRQIFKYLLFNKKFKNNLINLRAHIHGAWYFLSRFSKNLNVFHEIQRLTKSSHPSFCFVYCKIQTFERVLFFPLRISTKAFITSFLLATRIFLKIYILISSLVDVRKDIWYVFFVASYQNRYLE